MPVARLRTAGVEPATQAQPPPCRRPAAAAPAPALLSVEAAAATPAHRRRPEGLPQYVSGLILPQEGTLRVSLGN
jgi:hypothetical protein